MRLLTDGIDCPTYFIIDSLEPAFEIDDLEIFLRGLERRLSRAVAKALSDQGMHPVPARLELVQRSPADAAPDPLVAGGALCGVVPSQAPPEHPEPRGID